MQNESRFTGRKNKPKRSVKQVSNLMSRSFLHRRFSCLKRFCCICDWNCVRGAHEALSLWTCAKLVIAHFLFCLFIENSVIFPLNILRIFFVHGQRKTNCEMSIQNQNNSFVIYTRKKKI